MELGSVRKSCNWYIPECEYAVWRIILLLFLFATGCGCEGIHGFGNQIVPRQSIFKRQIRWAVNDPGQIVSRNSSVCLIEPLDDRYQVSVLDHPADFRRRIHIGTILLEQHCGCVYHIITTNCNNTAFSGENQVHIGFCVLHVVLIFVLVN